MRHLSGLLTVLLIAPLLAVGLTAAPASAQPLPTIEPTVENAAPTLDNIKLGITRAVETNPELESVGEWALTLFPEY